MFAIVLVTTFITTLQRLMRQKSFRDEGFLYFGIRAMYVLFIIIEYLLLLRMSKSILLT